MIKLSGDYHFDAPQDLVWDMFQDPDVLARIMPGCEKLEQVEENVYKGKLKIRVGPVQGVFQGKVELHDLKPPNSYRMVVNGRGPAGIVNGEGNIALSSDGDATMLNYEGEAQVSGRIASVGQRLMDTSAKSIVRQSLENLDAQIAARVAPPVVVVEEADVEAISAEIPDDAPIPTRTEAVLPPEPTQTDYMLGMTQDLLDEYVPDPTHRKLLAASAVGLIALMLMNWFANLVAKRVAAQLQNNTDTP